MFDVAFSEIVLIAVVALVVIGPERLPKVARTLGHMFGRLQRYVNEVKADINREIELDELRKLKNEVQTAAQNLEHSVTQAAQDVESGVHSVETQLNAADQGDGTPSQAQPANPVTPAAASAAEGVVPTTPAGSEPPRQGTLPGVDRI
jgi:sec-independent protein translocase protein TatB